MITYDSLKAMLRENRSYRRFDEAVKVDEASLRRLVELTRYCSSGRNLQPMRYRLVTGKECGAIFPYLKWAGYLPDWDGPAEGERPTAYMVQCIDTELTQNCLCDDGLHLEAITLGAVSMGLGCCIIKAFDVAKVAAALGIPSRYKLDYVLAIGRPVEKVRLVDTDGSADADMRYYRDAQMVHYVPKRPLDELIIG